jgi:hypothetical protein
MSLDKDYKFKLSPDEWAVIESKFPGEDEFKRFDATKTSFDRDIVHIYLPKMEPRRFGFELDSKLAALSKPFPPTPGEEKAYRTGYEAGILMGRKRMVRELYRLWNELYGKAKNLDGALERYWDTVFDRYLKEAKDGD